MHRGGLSLCRTTCPSWIPWKKVDGLVVFVRYEYAPGAIDSDASAEFRPIDVGNHAAGERACRIRLLDDSIGVRVRDVEISACIDGKVIGRIEGVVDDLS